MRVCHGIQVGCARRILAPKPAGPGLTQAIHHGRHTEGATGESNRVYNTETRLYLEVALTFFGLS